MEGLQEVLGHGWQRRLNVCVEGRERSLVALLGALRTQRFREEGPAESSFPARRGGRELLGEAAHRSAEGRLLREHIGQGGDGRERPRQVVREGALLLQFVGVLDEGLADCRNVKLEQGGLGLVGFPLLVEVLLLLGQLILLCLFHPLQPCSLLLLVQGGAVPRGADGSDAPLQGREELVQRDFGLLKVVEFAVNVLLASGRRDVIGQRVQGRDAADGGRIFNGERVADLAEHLIQEQLVDFCLPQGLVWSGRAQPWLLCLRVILQCGHMLLDLLQIKTCRTLASISIDVVIPRPPDPSLPKLPCFRAH